MNTRNGPRLKFVTANRSPTVRWKPWRAALAISAFLFSGVVTAEESDGPRALREFIDQQVGGINKLMVPALDADLPGAQLPDGTDASANPLYATTEAKRYLGKQLFHDPIRTARIIPYYGGVLATKQTGSCGSCHQGESASKAGTLINMNVGGEGRSYTDEAGNFIPRRRARVDILPRLRNTPLFPGDALVDSLPTLTDIYLVPPPPGVLEVDTPARGEKLPTPLATNDYFSGLVATGRLDALDSVARNAPGVLGAAFNNRLLLGGFAGSPDSAPGGLNPFNDPAQENVALLLLDAHRMLQFQSAELQKIPAFVKLFREAFPDLAAHAANDINLLINDQTVFRATATFMRTVVTRNTAWDHFLAGDNRALTEAQRRGAKLFFTPATSGAGGAGCYTCHSGPQFNKQVNDPDLAGVGKFVEENFYNLGLGDHPVQALNRAARKDPTFLDDGRREVTGSDNDFYKFRVVTLRQLKDARFYFHSGAFTKVRDVVEYFNAGVPQNTQSAASPTLTARFTNPRGPGYPHGLGLSEDQVNDLTDFLENALYDPAFVKYDPKSSTRPFQLSTPDFIYSVYRPDLAALGAKDGFPISGLAQDNNDPLSRRDLGLEFLDVTALLSVSVVNSGGKGDDDEAGTHVRQVYTITNNSSSTVDTNLLMIARGLSPQVKLENASGKTSSGDPYLRVFLRDGVLLPGQSITEKLKFTRRPEGPPVLYTLSLLSGQGTP